MENPRLQKVDVVDADTDFAELVWSTDTLAVRHVEEVSDEHHFGVFRHCPTIIRVKIEASEPLGATKFTAPSNRNLTRVVVNRVGQEFTNRHTRLTVDPKS